MREGGQHVLFFVLGKKILLFLVGQQEDTLKASIKKSLCILCTQGTYKRSHLDTKETTPTTRTTNNHYPQFKLSINVQ